jgi:hypothetical protein
MRRICALAEYPIEGARWRKRNRTGGGSTRRAQGVSPGTRKPMA